MGLCAALCAARRGLEVTLLEQNFRGYARGHAAILHPASLRVIADLGLSHQLLTEGRALNCIDLYYDGSHVQSLDLPQPALVVPQAALEEILLRALRRERVHVKLSHEVTALEQKSDCVRATVERRELVTLGSPANYSEWQPIDRSIVEARFVIGADGYQSFVRSALGVDNLQAGPTETFAMFEGPEFAPGANLQLAFGAECVSAALALAKSRARWGFQLGSELEREPNLDFLRSLLKRSFPWLVGEPESVEWSVVTHFERRSARHFGNQRTWLVGDAAHVTGPFGGQSMNVGLLEANALVEHIASCIYQQKPLATLEQWGAERECEWHRLLVAQAQIEAHPHAPGWLQGQLSRLIPALPASGRELDQLLRELGLVFH